MGMTNRWRRAQQAELASWANTSATVALTDELRQRSLQRISEFTLLNEEELKGMRILEIGGPLIEAAFDDVNIAPKLMLDPLLSFPGVVGQRDKTCHRVRGVGEFLPLPDKSMDLCWVANVIDHVSNPIAVLDEIHRVLSDRGLLVISCEIFPIWTRPLFPVFDRFDTPHPHHFTIRSVRSLLKRRFEIGREQVVSVATSLVRRNSQLSLMRDLKNKLATVIRVKYTYFICVPINLESGGKK